MCFAPKDNSGAIARQQEQERQQNIVRGTDKINAAFSGFDDDFYKQRETDYLDYYTPQLDEQAGDANDALTYNLARGGNLDSSTGAKQAADLTRKISDARGSVVQGAAGASQGARGDVENNRSDLIQMLQGGGNVANAANSAASRAEQLTRPPPYSPLLDLFSQGLGQTANSIQLQGMGYEGLPFTRRTVNPARSVSTIGGG